MAKINHIQSSELRAMKEEEGLILQGRGGDPQEWLEGVNDMFTKEGILLDGSVFKKVFVFKHDALVVHAVKDNIIAVINQRTN